MPPITFQKLSVQALNNLAAKNYILITDGLQYTKKKYTKICSEDHNALLEFNRISIDPNTKRVTFKDLEPVGKYEREINLSQHGSLYYDNGYYNTTFPEDMFTTLPNVMIETDSKSKSYLEHNLNISIDN